VWIANEGIRASRIVQALNNATASDFSESSHHAICKELLALWQRANVGDISRESIRTQLTSANAIPSTMPQAGVTAHPASGERNADPVDKRRRSIRIEIDFD